MALFRMVLWLGLFCSLWGADPVRFGNVELTTGSSRLMKLREEVRDPLLPPFDGEVAFRELLRKIPDLWSLEEMIPQGEVLTRLEIELEFIDGVREDQFCQILSAADTSEQGLRRLEASGNTWQLKLGVDLISGASNTAHDHIRTCLQEAREQLALVVRRDGVIEVLPPAPTVQQFEEYRVNADLDGKLKSRVLKVSREVDRTAECPRDIDDYLLLLDIWNQTGSTRVDLIQLSEELDPRNNGGRAITSCAYSREHNRRYTESWSLRCDVDREYCSIAQSGDGKGKWNYDGDLDRFYFRGFRLLGIGIGRQSIRRGGKVLDLKLVPLSSNLYLEAYLNEKGIPSALGLLTVAAD